MNHVPARPYEAVLDPSTGFYDRRTMWSRLAEESSRSRRYRYPLGLMLIKVNAPDPEQVGVWVVRLAHMLKERTRAVDILIRYGEDTLAVLLPCTDARGALCLAERIQKMARLLLSGENVAAPVSIGITSQVGEYRGDKVSLVEQVEWAVHKAAQTGQTVVVLGPVAAES